MKRELNVRPSLTLDVVWSVWYSLGADLVMLVSPLSLLKNPMILIALVAMAFMFGMPKLMENSPFTLLVHVFSDAC